jgi:hypothetical protein
MSNITELDPPAPPKKQKPKKKKKKKRERCKRHGHTFPLFLTSIKKIGGWKGKVGVWFSLHPHTLN